MLRTIEELVSSGFGEHKLDRLSSDAIFYPLNKFYFDRELFLDSKNEWLQNATGFAVYNLINYCNYEDSVFLIRVNYLNGEIKETWVKNEGLPNLQIKLDRLFHDTQELKLSAKITKESLVKRLEREAVFSPLAPEKTRLEQWKGLLIYNHEISRDYVSVRENLIARFAKYIAQLKQDHPVKIINIIVMGCGFGHEAIGCATQALQQGFTVNLLMSDYDPDNVAEAKRQLSHAFGRKKKPKHSEAHVADIGNLNRVLQDYKEHLTIENSINVLVSCGAFSFDIMPNENQRRTLQIVQTLFNHNIHDIIATGLTHPLFHSDLPRFGMYELIQFEEYYAGDSRNFIHLKRNTTLTPVARNGGTLDLSGQPFVNLQALLSQAKEKSRITTISLAFCEIDIENISLVINQLKAYKRLKTIILDCGFELEETIINQLQCRLNVKVIVLNKTRSVQHAFFGVRTLEMLYQQRLSSVQSIFVPSSVSAVTPKPVPAISRPIPTLGQAYKNLKLSPVEVAALENSMDIQNIPTKKGGYAKLKINAQSKIGFTVLMAAVKANIPRLVRYLLQHGCSVHSANKFLSVIHMAMAANVEILKLLIQDQADINLIFQYRTPLMLAAENNQQSHVQVLLACCADPNIVISPYFTAFYFSLNGYPKLRILFDLIIAGAEVPTEEKARKNILDGLSPYTSRGEVAAIVEEAQTYRVRTALPGAPLAVQVHVLQYVGLFSKQASSSDSAPLGSSFEAKLG